MEDDPRVSGVCPLTAQVVGGVALAETPQEFPGPDSSVHGKGETPEAVSDMDLRHDAAIQIDRAPLAVSATIEEYRPRLAARLRLDGSTTAGSVREAYAGYLVENSLRQTILRMLGYRLIGSSIDFIQATLAPPGGMDSGALSSDSQNQTFVGQFDRRHVGAEAALATGAREVIGTAIQAAFATFRPEEVAALADVFGTVTRSRNAAIERYLDLRCPDWHALPEQTLSRPLTDPSLPKYQQQLLAKLRDSHDVTVSFTGASQATSEFIATTLSDLHTALAAAGCPDDLWWPISYANLGKLQIPALLSFMDAHDITKDREDQTHPGIFAVRQEAGEWVVDFLDASLQRTYGRGQPVNCQGAFAIPPFNDRVGQRLVDVHRALKLRAHGKSLDVDVTHAASSTQMLTLLIVAFAERYGYKLSRLIQS